MDKNKRGSSLLAKGFSLSILTLFSRILGLLREMTKATFLGTSIYSDAFSIAFMIPNLFRRLFAENSISVAFIPTFKGYLEDSKSAEGKKSAQEFVNATFTLVTFLTVSFVTLGIIFTPLILRIFYAEKEQIAIMEATILTRIMFPYLVVISVAAFFQGILNSLKIFLPSGFTPILFNTIVVCSTYFLSSKTENPARAMAIGVLLGGFVQAAFQFPFVLKTGWRTCFTSLKKAFSNPGTKTVIRLVGPTIIGMAAYQLNDIVSSSLASRAGTGVVSSLTYSLRVQELILGICAVTIGTVILPDLTGFAKKEDWESFTNMLTQSITIMALIAIPITFYSLVMGENIITLLFAGGQFKEESIKLTTEVFYFHISGLFFIAVNRIISPAFYAQKDTKSPTWAGLINFALNMILAAVLVKKFGGKGIALALTIASFANTWALLFFLRKNPKINRKKLLSSTFLYAIKMIFFSIIAASAVYFVKAPICKLFKNNSRIISQGMPLFLTAIIFAFVGILLLFVSRDPLLKSLAKRFKKR